ncbi:MAG TPA: TetR/AcrR family transcriptional regulator [Labilithrix sp.]
MYARYARTFCVAAPHPSKGADASSAGTRRRRPFLDTKAGYTSPRAFDEGTTGLFGAACYSDRVMALGRLRLARVPTQRRSRETVDAVFEAAIRELARGDADAVNVNRVAEVAGVSIGSVYQYFPSKEALLSSLIVRFMRRRFEAIMQMIRDVEDEERRTGQLVPLETIMTRLVEGTVALNKKALPIERGLIRWFARVGSLDALTEVDQEFTARMADGIRILQATPGRVRDVDPAIAARILMQSIRSVILTAILQEPALLDDDAIARELAILATRYLAP